MLQPLPLLRHQSLAVHRKALPLIAGNGAMTETAAARVMLPLPLGQAPAVAVQALEVQVLAVEAAAAAAAVVAAAIGATGDQVAKTATASASVMGQVERAAQAAQAEVVAPSIVLEVISIVLEVISIADMATAVALTAMRPLHEMAALAAVESQEGARLSIHGAQAGTPGMAGSSRLHVVAAAAAGSAAAWEEVQMRGVGSMIAASLFGRFSCALEAAYLLLPHRIKMDLTGNE